jgi:hypothetical protein
MITDKRLQVLSGPDYARSEPGQIAAALLRSRELLRWAVLEIERQTELLARCHELPDGRMDQEDVVDEVSEARSWLADAKRAIA